MDNKDNVLGIRLSKGGLILSLKDSDGNTRILDAGNVERIKEALSRAVWRMDEPVIRQPFAPQWDSIPKAFKWVAQDPIGSAYAFKFKPKYCKQYKCWEHGREVVYLGEYPPPDKWEKAIWKRPKQK